MAISGEFTTTSAIDELTAYDSALAQRILDIEDGKAVNGHNPNGTLSSVLANEEGAGETFIAEYTWLVALHAFPFRDQEQKTSLVHAGTDALFVAGETYNPNNEPNFIIHSSQVIGDYLKEVFGEPIHPPANLELVIPPTEQIDRIEIDSSTLASPELAHTAESQVNIPTLPDERAATDFSEGQRLLFLWGGVLHSAQVIGVHASEQSMKFESAPISPEELAVREALYERRAAEICDSPELREAHYLMPDRELVRLLFSMRPEFQILTPNDNPGFLRIAFRDEPGGVIINMNHNIIIPKDDFEQLKKDPAYLAAWLEHGTPEDKRQEEALVRALRIQSRFPESDEDTPKDTTSDASVIIRPRDILHKRTTMGGSRHFY